MKTKKALIVSFAFSAFAASAMAFTGQAPTPPVNVPDSGATIALLGLAIAGLVAARRRFSK